MGGGVKGGLDTIDRESLISSVAGVTLYSDDVLNQHFTIGILFVISLES